MVEISVIIPCYNQESFLEESIESISKQTFKNFEVIIINDGSSDNSLGLAKRLQDKYHYIDIQIIDQKNSGVSNARNNGIKHAKAKYILPLDADDKLREDALEKFYNKITENQKFDIIYSDAYCFGEKDELCTKKDIILDRFPYEDQISYCAIYKKEVWEKTGGYKENMVEGYEDWEFWVNCHKRGFVFKYIQEALFYYRVKKVSRDTEAVKKDKTLRYKIVLNNPEIYPRELVLKASKYLHQKPKKYKESLKEQLKYLYIAWEAQEEIKTWMLELDSAKNWLEEHNKFLKNENTSFKKQINEYKEWIQKQDSIINEQKEWMQKQDSIIDEQKKWIQRQEKITKEHQEWIQKQDNVINEQKEWIKGQEQTIKKQEKITKEHQEWMQKQDNVINEQKEWMQKQDNVINEQKEWIQKQEEIIKRGQNLVKERDDMIVEQKNNLLLKEQQVNELQSWIEELENGKNWLEKEYHEQVEIILQQKHRLDELTNIIKNINNSKAIKLLKNLNLVKEINVK